MGRGFAAPDSNLPLNSRDDFRSDRGAFYIVITGCWLCRFRLSQFGSQFAGPESQTQASRANQSCEVRHERQKVLLKKTGIEPKAARSMFMLVEMHLPVLGQRITTVPISVLVTDLVTF